LVEHRPVVLERPPEVQPRDIADPLRVLHGDRLVKPESVRELRLVFGRDIRAFQQRRRPAGREMDDDECDQRDAEQQEDRLNQPPREKSCHVTLR